MRDLYRAPVLQQALRAAAAACASALRGTVRPHASPTRKQRFFGRAARSARIAAYRSAAPAQHRTHARRRSRHAKRSRSAARRRQRNTRCNATRCTPHAAQTHYLHFKLRVRVRLKLGRRHLILEAAVGVRVARQVAAGGARRHVRAPALVEGSEGDARRTAVAPQPRALIRLAGRHGARRKLPRTLARAARLAALHARLAWPHCTRLAFALRCERATALEARAAKLSRTLAGGACLLYGERLVVPIPANRAADGADGGRRV